MDIKDLELLKEKKQAEKTALKDPLYNQIHILENELASELAEIDTQLNEIKRINKLKADIKEKLSKDTFTSTEYNALSESDKLIAKQALFDFYAEQVNVYYGLNTIEYLLVPMIKIVGKCLDTANLSTQEKAFYDRLVATINTHPMTIDNVNTWEFNVIEPIMNVTMQRRLDYMNKKTQITGSF